MEPGVFRLRIWLGLSLFAFLATVAAIVFRGHPAVDALAPGLATETVGILLTLLVVQRLLQRQEKERRLRSSIGALRKAGRALGSLVRLWASLVKGALPREPEPMPDTLGGLLSPSLTEHLGRCDLSLRQQDPAGQAEGPLLDWVNERLDQVRRSLSEVIGTYGSALDARYIEALDALLDDPFLDAIQDVAREQRYRETGNGPIRLPPSPAFRDAHFERLLAVIELHNATAAEAARIRSDPTGVRTPLLGIERAPDQDLRVEFLPNRAWWLSSPRVGELRD